MDNEAGQRLADRVYAQLLEFIVERRLVQGDRLPSENELSRMTTVSRPIVREALNRLQADGLIESRRGSGSFLRQRPQERQIQHLRPAQSRARLETFEVRIALEPIGARLAATHRSERELALVRRAIEALSSALNRGEAAADPDLQFHRTVAAASQNAMFLLTLDTLDRQVDGIILPSLALVADDAGERAAVVEGEHLAVLDAIERSDPDAAEAAMKLHLVRARSRALQMRW